MGGLLRTGPSTGPKSEPFWLYRTHPVSHDYRRPKHEVASRGGHAQRYFRGVACPSGLAAPEVRLPKGIILNFELSRSPCSKSVLEPERPRW